MSAKSDYLENLLLDHLFRATLTTAKTVNNGDPAPSFPSDALTITEA